MENQTKINEIEQKICSSDDCGENYTQELEFYPGYCSAYCHYQAGG